MASFASGNELTIRKCIFDCCVLNIWRANLPTRTVKVLCYSTLRHEEDVARRVAVIAINDA